MKTIGWGEQKKLNAIQTHLNSKTEKFFKLFRALDKNFLENG